MDPTAKMVARGVERQQKDKVITDLLLMLVNERGSVADQTTSNGNAVQVAQPVVLEPPAYRDEVLQSSHAIIDAVRQERLQLRAELREYELTRPDREQELRELQERYNSLLNLFNEKSVQSEVLKVSKQESSVIPFGDPPVSEKSSLGEPLIGQAVVQEPVLCQGEEFFECQEGEEPEKPSSQECSKGGGGGNRDYTTNLCPRSTAWGAKSRPQVGGCVCV